MLIIAIIYDLLYRKIFNLLKQIIFCQIFNHVRKIHGEPTGGKYMKTCSRAVRTKCNHVSVIMLIKKKMLVWDCGMGRCF